MYKFLNVLLLVVFVILVALFSYKTLHKPDSFSSPAVTTEKAPVSYSKEEIEAIIKNYIFKHPEDIIKSVEEMQKKLVSESEAKIRNYVDTNKAEIHDSTLPYLGNVDGKSLITLFYDYNCGYCKQANQYLEQLIAEDSSVKVILRPLPLLSNASSYAARFALAVYKISNEKFKYVHDEMLQRQPLDEAKLTAILEKHGIDKEVVKNEINSYGMEQVMNKNIEVAKSVGVKGAPSYVIHNHVMSGLANLEKLKSALADTKSLEDKR